MHPYFLYDIHKQYLAEWEREAELQRLFMEGRPRRQKRRISVPWRGGVAARKLPAC